MEFEYVATSYNGMFVSGSRNFDTPSAYQLVNDCRPEGFNSSNAVLVANCISKSECGTQQNLTRNKDSPRISGGTEAIPKSNPWLVALFVNGTFQCAGTIINRKWVKINFSHQTRLSKFPVTFEWTLHSGRSSVYSIELSSFCSSVTLALHIYLL